MRLIDHAGEASVSIHETADFIEDKPELAELGIDPIEHSPTNNLGGFCTTTFKQEKQSSKHCSLMIHS